MKLPRQASVSVLPEDKGFWIAIESRAKYSFAVQYIAIGSAGNQLSGDVSGFSGKNHGWIFVPTPFPLLKAGIVSITLVESKRKMRVGKRTTIQPPPFEVVPSSSSGFSRTPMLGPSGRIELLPSGRTKGRRVTTGSGYGGYAYEYAYAYGYDGAQRLPTRGPTKKSRKTKRRVKKPGSRRK
jgi:hypothetical protein